MQIFLSLINRFSHETLWKYPASNLICLISFIRLHLLSDFSRFLDFIQFTLQMIFGMSSFCLRINVKQDRIFAFFSSPIFFAPKDDRYFFISEPSFFRNQILSVKKFIHYYIFNVGSTETMDLKGCEFFQISLFLSRRRQRR